MGTAKAQIEKYIRSCLRKGWSFRKVEKDLISRGYPTKVAEGIILSYRHRGNVIKWMTVSVLFVVFFSSVFLSSSGIVGMATIRYKQNFEDRLNLIMTENGEYSWIVPHEGELVSVLIDIDVIGDGDARVYLENNEKLFLVFDSTKEIAANISSSDLGTSISHYNSVCESTCNLEGFNKSIYNLVFEVENATIEITNLYYGVRADLEAASVPEFSKIPSQDVGVNEELKIDLNSFFNYSYGVVKYDVITEGDLLNVSIDDAIATVRPQKVGKTFMYFTASVDGVDFISNLIVVNVVNSDQDNADIITGDVKRVDQIKEDDSQDFIKHPYILLGFMLIVLLAAIPGVYYNLDSLASKIDRFRHSDKISSELKDYEKLKASLSKQKSKKDKVKMIDEMEEKIKEMEHDIPKYKVIGEFNDLCAEFEKTVKRNKTKARKIYLQIRELYTDIIDKHISSEEKKEFFNRVESYYELLGGKKKVTLAPKKQKSVKDKTSKRAKRK